MRSAPDPRARQIPRRAIAAAAVAWLLVAGSCGGSPLTRRPDAETYARLAAAERAWRAESADYPALRDELRQDPVAAIWLTRLFVCEVLDLRGATRLGFGESMRVQAANVPAVMQAGADATDEAAKAKERLWKRAIREIVVLGEAGVPVLVAELLRSEQVHLRQFGVELLGYVGEPAIPALLEASRSNEAEFRRSAAQALAAQADHPEVLTRLRALTRDPEFTVRADAARSLRGGGSAACAVLCELLATERDPFVRRSAAKALGGHRSRPAAEALIDFLAACVQAADARGHEAAQEALKEMFEVRGTRQPSIEQWRTAAASLPE